MGIATARLGLVVGMVHPLFRIGIAANHERSANRSGSPSSIERLAVNPHAVQARLVGDNLRRALAKFGVDVIDKRVARLHDMTVTVDDLHCFSLLCQGSGS